MIECHIIRFCRPMMQKTAYELWLKDQKVDMHLKCARFLEENAHKCDRCHSGDFIPYHHFTVDIRLNSLDMDSIRKMAKSQGFKSKLTSFLISSNRSWRRCRFQVPLRYTRWQFQSRGQGGGQTNPLSSEKDLGRSLHRGLWALILGRQGHRSLSEDGDNEGFRCTSINL